MKRTPVTRRFAPDAAPRLVEAFAVAAPGIESIVAVELDALGITNLTVIDGGVEFSATRRQLYLANLHLRTASRVLVRLARFRALTFAELERRLQRVEWQRMLRAGDQVALRVTCRKSRLYHSDAVAERVERDLATRMKTPAQRTPSSGEDDEEPDAQLIIARFDHDRCTISADSSGAHLHQRGYRTAVTGAPMRETLAAALLIASGWDRRTPLLDPFCGSGTIPIEAAMMAAHLAPGRNRDFRFQRWPDFDAGEWKRVRTAATSAETRVRLPVIAGSDRSAAAISAAEHNAVRAGVDDLVRFTRIDAAHLTAPAEPGHVVTNPPYGIRLGDAAASRELLSRFATVLRERFAAWYLTALLPPAAGRALRLPTTTLFTTTNGGLRVAAVGTRIPALEPHRAVARDDPSPPTVV